MYYTNPLCFVPRWDHIILCFFFLTLYPVLFIHVCVLSRFSRVQLFVTPWIVAQQAPLSMGFYRQEYWSGWPCPLPGDLPDPGIKPASLMSLSLAGGFFTTSVTWENLIHPFLLSTRRGFSHKQTNDYEYANYCFLKNYNFFQCSEAS